MKQSLDLRLSPVRPEHGENKFTRPPAFEPNVLAKMGFLAEASTLKQGGRSRVFHVDHRHDPMLIEDIEEIADDAFDGLAGVPAPLKPRRKGDAEFGLSRIFRPAKEAAVTGDLSRGNFNDRQLEPFPGTVQVRRGLLLNELGCLGLRKAFPRLVTRNFRLGPISGQGRGIFGLKPAQLQASRKQREWTRSVHVSQC